MITPVHQDPKALQYPLTQKGIKHHFKELKFFENGKAIHREFSTYMIMYVHNDTGISKENPLV